MYVRQLYFMRLPDNRLIFIYELLKKKSIRKEKRNSQKCFGLNSLIIHMKTTLLHRNMSIKKNSITKKYIKNYQLILLALPGLLAIILFNYVPMAGVIIAFKKYLLLEGIWGSPWVGLENFKTALSGFEFWRVFKNTIFISFLKLVFGFPMPIILALLLNEMRNAVYKKFVQTLTYLPHFFSWVMLGGIFMMLFSVTGPINYLLSLLGIDKPLEFFGNGKLFVGLLVFSSIWQGMGWSSIIYLASLTSIDTSLYEAASIDGASRFKQVWHVTLPALVPTIITVLILNLSSILNAGFDQIYNLYNPTVYEVSDILDTYVLRLLRSMDYGVGSAIGLFKSVICMIFVYGTNYISKKLSDDSLGIM